MSLVRAVLPAIYVVFWSVCIGACSTRVSGTRSADAEVTDASLVDLVARDDRIEVADFDSRAHYDGISEDGFARDHFDVRIENQPDAALKDSTADTGTLPNVVLCGGQQCMKGQACCYATGHCYDLESPSACALPDRTVDHRACASNAQCVSGELCDFVSTSSVCVGIGTCRARREPSECGGFGEGVCGCDGQTWSDPCAASRAGVRVAAFVPCGQRLYPGQGPTVRCSNDGSCPRGWACDTAMHQCVPENPIVACARDAQCPAGHFCCGHTGLCVSRADPEFCRSFSQPSIRVACRTSEDCQRLDTSPFGGGSNFFCFGEGCDGIGGCLRRPSVSDCSGALTPVCGCNGMSYTNECTASSAGVRVAHPGMCPQ